MTENRLRAKHHHGNLKEALVAYALAAADRGELAGLSVRQAARDLGVSAGAAYRHFPDKDDLLRTVAQRGFDALAVAFEQAIPFRSAATDGEDARRRFVALAKTYVDFARDRTELWRLMFGPFGRVAGRNTDRPSTYDWLAKALGEMAGFGLIMPPQPDHQFFVWSAIHGVSDLQGSAAAAETPRETLVERHCQLVITALAGQS